MKNTEKTQRAILNLRSNDLAKLLSKETDLTPNEAKTLIKLLFSLIKQLLAAGHTIRISKFGLFRVVELKEKTHFSGFSKKPKSLGKRKKIKLDNSISVMDLLSRSKKN